MDSSREGRLIAVDMYTRHRAWWSQCLLIRLSASSQIDAFASPPLDPRSMLSALRARARNRAPLASAAPAAAYCRMRPFSFISRGGKHFRPRLCRRAGDLDLYSAALCRAGAPFSRNAEAGGDSASTVVDRRSRPFSQARVALLHRCDRRAAPLGAPRTDRQPASGARRR